MKRIDAVELYVRKRIEMLEHENGKYNFNEKALCELNDVIDFINKVNYMKQKRNDEKFGFLLGALDKTDKGLLEVEED